MSTRHIPYPSDFDVTHDASRHEERRRRALAALDPGDIIATVEDLLASEPDPAKHPLYPVANWLLDRQWAVDGGAFWDAWRALCQQALDQCVTEALARGEG
jgi:hypothetical protein